MTNPSSAANLEELFPVKSEMAGITRSFNWSATELGPTQRWPANLYSAVRICLTSRFPILVSWGPQLKVLYSDANLPFLSERKRTRALMRPGRVVCSEMWDSIGPMLAGVLETGVATGSGDFEFFLAAQREFAGLIVVGISPRRPLDTAYRIFLDLVAGHVAGGIPNAQVYAAECKHAEAPPKIERAKTVFSSNVSHEFRTPVTMISVLSRMS